jgi:hypothetical protein
LCTATQPAFDDKRCLHAAFPQINEIIGKVQVIVYPKVSADRLPLMGQKFQLIVYLIQ